MDAPRRTNKTQYLMYGLAGLGMNFEKESHQDQHAVPTRGERMPSLRHEDNYGMDDGAEYLRKQGMLDESGV
ncbi:hypothetical protein EMCG_01152 [[Emmonsia] crescens]|uniref:Uncharacterized protein n=1 Tax=[Emmonsia] crescens TaxID=73230 RepID=A0A0G2JAQ0_9EURO|nr:hypothetical protein EMCG_01152 [Emmonsia crescens UAMH 3008]